MTGVAVRPVGRNSGFECVIHGDDAENESIFIDNRQAQQIEVSHPCRDGDDIVFRRSEDGVSIRRVSKEGGWIELECAHEASSHSLEGLAGRRQHVDHAAQLNCENRH